MNKLLLTLAALLAFPAQAQVLLKTDTANAGKVAFSGLGWNYPQITGAATGSPVTFTCTGLDSNVGCNFVTTGSGTVQINGTSLAASATTDTTNASNISSGTLGQTRLPAQLYTSGTFASKPGSPVTAQHYYATDLGSGMEIIYNGSKWMPVGGVGTLYADSTYHSATATGSEQNIISYSIPAGLLSTSGAIHILGNGSYTGTAGTKTVNIRLSTATGVTGTAIMTSAMGGSTTALSATFEKWIQNDASASTQTSSNTNVSGVGISNTQAILAPAINTANISYLNFDITGTASDVVGFKGVYIFWIEQ